MREYPIIPSNIEKPKRPISFICVKFSKEFEHNIIKSDCVQDDMNEFIVIDNTKNIFYINLGQAINAGIKQAKHDLLVIVHEDVVLLPGWQNMFEQSLNALETKDPEWLVAGVVGWNTKGRMKGHLSDPHSYRNSMLGKPFAEIIRIDEQVLILRKSKNLFLDPELPSIHHIGRDLPLEANKRGYKSYVLDAPSIHKYADAHGHIIETAKDSDKIQHRRKIQYLADRACSNEYIGKKWPSLDIYAIDKVSSKKWGDGMPPQIIKANYHTDPSKVKILDSPLILLGKGGSGSRLLTTIAQDLNIFIGNDINSTGDSREMVPSVYRGLIRKYRCPNKQQKLLTVPDIRETASQMLEQAEWPINWAFKSPESVFILDELNDAFPNARYVFLDRDPLQTVLRRTHMTARLDNQIGQITLPLAYDYFDLEKHEILRDSSLIHMCRTTSHQLEMLLKFKQNIPSDKWLNLNFKDLIINPKSHLVKLSKFTGMTTVTENILLEFNHERATLSNTDFPKDLVETAKSILEPIRIKFDYL